MILTDLNMREIHRNNIDYNKCIKHNGYSLMVQTDDLERRERHTNNIDI